MDKIRHTIININIFLPQFLINDHKDKYSINIIFKRKQEAIGQFNFDESY